MLKKTYEPIVYMPLIWILIAIDKSISKVFRYFLLKQAS